MKKCPTCGLKYPNDETRCFVDRSALELVPDPRIGMLLRGRYKIEEALGEGGMAVVYRARNVLVEREVAVKIMNAALAPDPALKERFRREAKNAAAVAHPNIIDIYDYGETDDGTPFLVMELLDGEPLDRIIARGPMAAGLVAAIGVQIARGLARAHDFSVIHRDLKPENIFVGVSDAGPPLAKLLDFGIARSMHDSRLTSNGQIFGTPQYMAPERVTSIDGGASSDLYALGVILFEMVAGRLPFLSKDLPGYFIQHLQDPPPPLSQLVPDVPRRLDELIASLLAKKPEERPVDAHAVVKALEPLVPRGLLDVVPAQRPPSQRPPSVAPTLPPTTLERWAQRTAIFEQMLARAYPQGDPPATQVQGLAELRDALARIHDRRSEGLKEQRKLEQLEASAQEGRERLGRAVHVLASDLSSAREAARNAHREVQPYFEAERSAFEAYRTAHERFFELGGGGVLEQPTTPTVSAARETAECLDRWLLARTTAEKAQHWVDAKQREVSDLEFQVDALRNQLERLETRYEGDRSASEEAVRHLGEEISRLEARLGELGSRWVDPLRTRPELRDLFARLEHEAAAE